MYKATFRMPEGVTVSEYIPTETIEIPQGIMSSPVHIERTGITQPLTAIDAALEWAQKRAADKGWKLTKVIEV